MEIAQFSTRRHETVLGASLPDLLKQQAEAQPEAIAVTYGDQRLTRFR